jgi:Family of unknown function (DUF6326)
MKTKKNLEDSRINVKVKLSALWISVMFCYVYGDFFSLFIPGRIQGLMNGNSGAGKTTPLLLLAFAVLMTIPSLMIFLSLVVKPRINRWINIFFGSFFTLIMALIIATSLEEWRIFYVYLAFVEVVLTSLVVWYAWTWPRQKE